MYTFRLKLICGEAVMAGTVLVYLYMALTA